MKAWIIVRNAVEEKFSRLKTVFAAAAGRNGKEISKKKLLADLNLISGSESPKVLRTNVDSNIRARLNQFSNGGC